jgi:hypothetical protein
MKCQIKMIIQYEVVEKTYSQYKEAIHHVFSKLPSFEAVQMQLDESQNTVMETFFLPTESHYYALKKLRKSKSHTLFGCLDPFIKGGVQEIDCYGIKR